jgi:fructokinase
MLVTCAGILVCDIIAADLKKISNPGEVTFTPSGIKLCIGGHSANVSIDLIKLGLKKGSVSSIGAIGNDIFGEFIEKELKKYNVITHLEKVKEAGTSIDLILVVKGEDRRFHIDVGANYYLSPDHVKSILKEEKPFIFYVGATGLLGKFDEKLSNILQEAKMLGCITFVDPVVPYKHGWEYLISSLKWIDIFHCNNIEALNMTGKENLEEAIEDLLKKGVNLVIVTMGENGLIARNKEVRIKMPAFKVKTIDPTGAGDAFCAGVIYHIIQTMYNKKLKISELSINELILTLLEGEAAGAACVTDVGTTTAVTRENVDKLLKEQESIIMKNTLISKVKS